MALALRIASHLAAHVRGDEGELYASWPCRPRRRTPHAAKTNGCQEAAVVGGFLYLRLRRTPTPGGTWMAQAALRFLHPLVRSLCGDNSIVSYVAIQRDNRHVAATSHGSHYEVPNCW